ncbi:MAG: glycine cleavage system protein H [Actinomycetota bacterium]
MSVEEVVRYKQSRFSSWLPAGRRYTRGHYWLREEEPGLWCVGFTKFAIRMLGDLVEYGFEVTAGDPVEVGQPIGSVEGFKAITELYCVGDGEFVSGNAELEKDITLFDTDPYHRGWLYRFRGTPDPDSVDVHGYVNILDATIQKMLASAGASGENE